MSQKTVFLSYRRDPLGKTSSKLLQQSLTHLGYDVFRDVDSVNAGQWATQIATEVPKRSHFLLLLTPDALDRCAEADDWVRREFESALASRRNIVPVIAESANLDALQANCPADMRSLFDYQAVSMGDGSFDADLAKLVARFLSPHHAPQPAPDGTRPRHAISRLRHTAPQLFGREAAIQRLDDAWADPRRHVVVIRNWGGIGKTSLVAEWIAQWGRKDWQGVERFFDWTFYSQGTRRDGAGGDRAASADQFIAAALAFCGDPDPTRGSPWDRGARLAALVAQSKCLLVLDGVEPLQQPPGPLAGQLTDPALAALLKGLAQRNPGLCVVTTREYLPDLASHYGKTADDWRLDTLTAEAGAELLHSLGVTRAGAAAIGPRDRELLAAAGEVDGHALTLQLMGRYLAKAKRGDVRQRDVFDFAAAETRFRTGHVAAVARPRPPSGDGSYLTDHERPYGHAFTVMAEYETWLPQNLADGDRELAILRLMGLFDRPADPGCLAALRAAPAIAGLTEPLVGLSDDDWEIAVSQLEEIGLVTREWRTATTYALDAHPLVREYFAWRLQRSMGFQPVIGAKQGQDAHATDHGLEGHATAWTTAHRRLYEHLCRTTEHRPDALAGLQPLYQAVAHGCHAGLHEQACADVYIARILRGTQDGGFYSSKKLGANGADLGAVACFFETPWQRLSPNLSPADQAWLLNEAAFRLRALGRLTEAVEPMRAGLEMRVAQEVWKSAAIIAGNLSELELTLGAVSAAVTSGEQSVAFADRSQDAFERMGNRATHADALHQAGQRAESLALFLAAETIQAEMQPEYPRLYSLRGFRYCDLLLADAQRAAWQATQYSVLGTQNAYSPQTGSPPETLSACDEVAERAAYALDIAQPSRMSLLTIALDHLTLGRAALYRALLSGSPIANPNSNIEQAVDGLRAAGTVDLLPLGLLTRAWQRRLTGDERGSLGDLDEAWEIAERGSMRPYQADIQLTRARLFHDRMALSAARALIQSCGYHRRAPELADATAASSAWPVY